MKNIKWLGSKRKTRTVLTLTSVFPYPHSFQLTLALKHRPLRFLPNYQKGRQGKIWPGLWEAQINHSQVCVPINSNSEQTLYFFLPAGSIICILQLLDNTTLAWLWRATYESCHSNVTSSLLALLPGGIAVSQKCQGIWKQNPTLLWWPPKIMPLTGFSPHSSSKGKAEEGKNGWQQPVQWRVGFILCSFVCSFHPSSVYSLLSTMPQAWRAEGDK